MSKNTTTCFKSKFRKTLDRDNSLTSNLSITRNRDPNFNRRPVKKNKPLSYKKQLGLRPSASIPNSTPFSLQLRENYIKNGVLTNAHKKFLNMVSSQRVVKNSCKTCSKSIRGLSL